LRALTPICRQWRSAASRGSRRSAASESGMSPAPPCKAMAHPILSQAVSSFPLKSERERAEWSWSEKQLCEVVNIYRMIWKGRRVLL
jgi:hypothetical protein